MATATRLRAAAMLLLAAVVIHMGGTPIEIVSIQRVAPTSP